MTLLVPILLLLVSLAQAYRGSRAYFGPFKTSLQYSDPDSLPRPSNNDEIYEFTRFRRPENPLVKRRGMPKYERDIKRRKLFILSTVLEDLLPDPTQGQSKVLNSFVDAGKITKRAALKLFNYIFELPTSLSVVLVLLLFAYSGTLYLPFVPPFLRLF